MDGGRVQGSSGIQQKSNKVVRVQELNAGERERKKNKLQALICWNNYKDVITAAAAARQAAVHVDTRPISWPTSFSIVN